MKQFAWRKGFPAKIEAQVFGEIVERIEQKNGLVKAEDIVAEAQRPTSPIREAFEWDDAAAAEAFRKDQARALLGALTIVRVTVEQGPDLSNKAMFVVRDDKDRRGYRSADIIMTDRDMRAQIISAAKRELESFMTKYVGVLAMGSYIPRLNEIVDGMKDEIDQLETEANRRRQARAKPSAEGNEVHAA
jgi:hypothetical protein